MYGDIYHNCCRQKSFVASAKVADRGEVFIQQKFSVVRYQEYILVDHACG